MYPGKYATQHPDRAAFIMANTGESVSYAEYEARSNRLAHLLRAKGLKRLDHYAIFMENNNRYLETGSAGYRAGLYFTCINSYLTPAGAGLYRQQQRIEAVDHVAREAVGGGRGAEILPEGHAVPGGGRRRRPGAALQGLRRGNCRIPGHPDCRRMPGHGDAVFIRHHRPAQGHPAAVARAASGGAAAAVRIS